MTLNKKFLLAGAAMALSVGGLYASQSQAATSNLAMEAVIVAAVTINCATSDLDFGNIAASTAGGANTVVMSPAGVRSIAGAGNGILIAGGTPSNGTCSVTGATGATIGVSLPATATVTNGGNTMTVGSFLLDTIGTDGASPQTFTATAGPDLVHIGGDLVVSQGQAAGTYTGNLVVTADYQ